MTVVSKILLPTPVGPKLVSFVNLFSYGVLRKNPECLKQIDILYLDGSLMVWIFRLFGHSMVRRSFDTTSVGADILKDAAQSGKRICFIGGEQGVSRKAADILMQKFVGLQVVSAYSGYFESTQDRAETIVEIVQSTPDIVIVGMGAGLQELLLGDLRLAGFTGNGYTCGGFLHQTAGGSADYYPPWINRMNLRWLYRCVYEPKVIKRVFVDYPVNSIRLFKDYSQWKRKKLQEKA